MFNQAKNNIFTITRGDSGYILCYINGGTPLDPIGLQLEENQELYFGVTEPNQPFEFAILKKKYDYENPPEYTTAEIIGKCWCGQVDRISIDGSLIKINLQPQDTVCLLPGKYYYSIKLKTNTLDGEGKILSYTVNTIVDKAIFNVVG